jgi:hypothetical protein
MPVSKRSGLPRAELAIDHAAHGFLIDTGASFTMVSEVVLLTRFTFLARLWLECGMKSCWRRRPFKTSGRLTLVFGLRSVMLSRNTYGTNQPERRRAV